MEEEWVFIDEGYPEDGELVEAEFWDRKTEKYYRCEAIFRDNEMYRSWEVKCPEGTDLICLPESWRRYPKNSDKGGI